LPEKKMAVAPIDSGDAMGERRVALTRVFVHGLEGSSRGTKAVFFKERYPDMVIHDFQGNLEERTGQMIRLLSGKEPMIIVGSSFGGLMATLFACKYPRQTRKLILLAPALSLPEFRPFLGCRIGMPVYIYHGNRDRVVPPEPVRRIAREIFLDQTFVMVDDDHMLRNTFRSRDWDALLEVQSVVSKGEHPQSSRGPSSQV
jgi:predicted esterase